MLTNKAGFWKSDDSWSINSQGHLVYIENTSKQKVVQYAAESDGRSYVHTILRRISTSAILENFELNKSSQLWKKGQADDEGYFKLTSAIGLQNVLTAKSVYQLKVDIGM